MNILALAFSSSLLQRTDHHTSLDRNGLRTQCPVVDTHRPLKNKTREDLQVIKCQEHTSDYGCGKKFSGELDCSRELTGDSKPSGMPAKLSHSGPAKRNSKKKKRRKWRSNKLHTDNNLASETVDMSKFSLSTGLVECDRANATVCSETATEVICKSVHDKVEAKHDASSESTFRPAGSNYFPNTTDTACFTSSSKINSDSFALQDWASSNNIVDGTYDTNYARNREASAKAVQGPSIITSVAPDSMGSFSEDARDSDTKPAYTTSSFLDNSRRTQPGNNNQTNIQTYETRSNGACFGMKSSDTLNELPAETNYSIRGSNMEPPCSGCLLADSTAFCPGNLDSSLGGNKTDKYDSRKDVKSMDQSSKIGDIPAVIQLQNTLGLKGADRIDMNMDVTSRNQSSGVIDVHAIETLLTSEHNKRDSQISNGTTRIHSRAKNKKIFGKENAYFTWQRTGRYIESSQHVGRNASDHSQQCMDAASSETTSLSKHCFSNGEGRLPSPHIPQSTDVFQQRAKKLSGVAVQRIYKNQGHILVEASEHATRENFHARHGQYVLRPRKDDGVGSSSSERPEMTVKSENANHGMKELWVSKSNLRKLENRKAFPDDIKPNKKAMTTSIEGVETKSFCASSIEEDTSSLSSGIELPYDRPTKEFTSRISSPVWIPVGKKQPTQKISEDIDHTKFRKESEHQVVNNDALCEACSLLDISKGVHKYNGLIIAGKRNLGKDKTGCRTGPNNKSGNLPKYICSDLAEQALGASYASQIASESFLLATGNPVAEFEKLLHSSSPIVARISFHQSYVVKQELMSELTVKPPKPIALRDVWSWYEGPGNYGLQVKAEDSQNSKALESNVSFHAHFVPYLSAIQLYSRPYRSVGSSSENSSDGATKRGETLECSCPSPSLCISTIEPVAEISIRDSINSTDGIRPCDIPTSDGEGCSTSACSVWQSDDSNVIFEYFEHEPPQHRKPLFTKIKELLDAGTANSQIFGDPSNLECEDLQDLHPASWYSVAWYPIYRIPEGCFRASFLTYHSLGHFCLGTKSGSVEENVFCVAFPALGMLSYNAQAECWFYPLKDGKTAVDASELLTERLKGLEETAALFSRGRVCKNYTAATNRHPDYEFFHSRKK